VIYNTETDPNFRPQI